MRVLHVAETIKGGIASHLDEILPSQMQQYGSDNVRLLGPEDHFQYLESVPRHALHKLGGGEGRPKRTLRLAWRIRQMQAEFKPDVIHAHSSLAGAALRLPLLIASHRPGVVYCPHGWAFAMDIQKWKRKVYALSERMMLRVTDAVVNVSDTERTLAIRNGLRLPPLRVVRNGVALESPVPPATTPTGFDSTAINLLFVGRYSHQKGLDLLLAAARRCTNTNVVFHVVGERHEGYDPTAEGIPDNVRLYGWVTRAQVAHYLADADALVMPSRWEGMPMIALEAMRAYKPIIVNDIEIMREIVNPNENGLLISAEDIDHFAEILTQLNKNDLIRMGRHARAAFEASFTSATQIADLDALYREIRDAA